MNIVTSSGHRFGMTVKSITTGIEGTVVGITNCIAGCELLEVKSRDDKDVVRTHVFSSKLVEIVNSDRVDEYENIYNDLNLNQLEVRLGDEVEDTVSESKGIVIEIQYTVNESPNVLLIKEYSEHNAQNMYASARIVSCKRTGKSIADTIINNRNRRERGELNVELLQKAKCLATGATGLISAIFNQASGTISVGIQPTSESGKLLDVHYTDIELVEIITETAKDVVQPEGTKLKKSGCMRSHELTSLRNSACRTA